MRQQTKMGRVAMAAALVVGALPVAHPSLAEQGMQRDQGSQHDQGNPHQGAQPDQGSQHNQGSQDQGSPRQGAQQDQGATQEQGAQDPSGGQAAAAQLVTASATVVKVDKANRMVTLKNPQGENFDVKVGPDVKLDRIKAGDRVNASYYEEVAIQIGTPGKSAAPKMTSTTTQRGGVTAQQATLTAKIQSVDLKKNTVLVRGPQGKTHTLKVDDPDLQAKLHKIKPGDTVDITYTQAVAVSVEPAK